jgi:prephenate dehydrogenase
MKSKVLGICGGKGKMAQWFISLFQSEFKNIELYDLDSKISLKQFVSKCDLLLVSVPICHTVKVIEEIGHHCKKEQLVMDFTSLKEEPCRALEKLSCFSIGLHPLFGPLAKDPKSLKMVFCVLQQNPWEKKIKALFQAKQIEIIEMSPKEHDQSMAYVQALNHGLHLMLGEVLIQNKIKELSSIGTPSFSLFIHALQHILKNDPKLYRDIAFENPYSVKALEDFQSVLNKYIEIVKTKKSFDFEEGFKSLRDQMEGI